MHNISRSVVKKDHAPKMEGRSVYVCDIDKHGILCGKMLRSKYARAKLLSVKVPELPDGYFYVDKNDVPGDNNVNIVMDDTPVYARETVEYIGEPIGMVCGPDEAVCEDILSRIEVWPYEVCQCPQMIVFSSSAVCAASIPLNHLAFSHCTPSASRHEVI